MRGDVSDLILLIVVGLAVAVSALVKSFRERKAREERMYRLRHHEAGQDPVASPPKPAAPSPLLQFRQFMEQLQGQSGKGQMEAPPASSQQQRIHPAGPGVRPPQAVPVHPVKQAAVRPGRGKLTEHLDEKEAKAPVVAQPPHERVSPLAAIYGSERSDFEKAVLLSEVLGKPVTLRRPVPPRQRS